MLVAWAGDVWACTPVDPLYLCKDWQSVVATSDYVFKAKFIKIRENPAKNNVSEKVDGGYYKISKIWKGKDIKPGDVIIADRVSDKMACIFRPNYAQSGRYYYFYVRRCKQNECIGSNHFVRMHKCGGIALSLNNLDEEINQIIQNNRE